MQNRIVISLAAALALTMAIPAVAQENGRNTTEYSGKKLKGGGKHYRNGGNKYRSGGRYYRGGGSYSQGGGDYGDYSEGGGNVSQYGTPDVIRGIGTYAGDLYATRFPGNGNYFYIGGDGGYYPAQDLPSPSLPREGAKIIDVEEAIAAMKCDEATKVCLIKP